MWQWCHAIDDVIDREGAGPEARGAGPTEEEDETARRLRIVRTFAEGIVVLSHPFYLANLPALRISVLQVSQLYALAAQWETMDRTSWQYQWAEVQRHAGMQLATAVAMICGGWDHAQMIQKIVVAESQKI